MKTGLTRSEAQQRSWANGLRRPINMAMMLEKAVVANKARFEASRPADQIQTSEEYDAAAGMPPFSRFSVCDDGCGVIVPLLARERSQACPECREIRVDRIIAARKMAAA